MENKKKALAACSHLVVTSPNVRRITKFVKTFFEVEPYHANPAFAEFVLENGFRIAFFAPTPDTRQYFGADGERHFASLGVTTHCIDRLYAKTQTEEYAGMGVRVSGPPKEHPWGEKSFLLIDPDGNRWEITESPSATGMLVNR